MTLVGAGGVVAGGDDGSIAEHPGLGLGQAEAAVGEAALAVAGQPGLLGQDEPERADGREIAGEQGLEGGGVAVTLGRGPAGQERLDSLHGRIFPSAQRLRVRR
jgi:hypothetical protein